MENYLLIHKSILPEYYEKVLEARHLLEAGYAKDVSQAVKKVGISRSTFYKYKDFILEPSETAAGRKAVITAMLSHEAGMLSALLSKISSMGANVLAITQSLPIRGKASVTVSLDVDSMEGSLTELIDMLSQIPGVEQLKILAAE